MATAIIYTSKLGSTKQVAEFIASKIGAEAIQLSDTTDPSKYDRIILGSGVYAGKVSKKMRIFIESHKDQLKNASLFVCCMFGDEKGAKQLEKISESTGIADAIFFDSPKDQISGKKKKLGEYIESL